MSRGNRVGIALLLLAGAAATAQESRVEEEKPANFAGMVANSVTGEPVAHVRIYLGHNAKVASFDYRAVTGTDGRFFIHDIKPSRYFLGGERRGYSNPGSSWFGGDENGPRSFTFGPGEEIKDIVVKLMPDSAIAGRVLDSSGVPMERVFLQAIGGPEPAVAETDDRGEFRIGGLHPGRYLVLASRDNTSPPEVRKDGTMPVNYRPTWFPGSATAATATPVTVQAGQDAGDIEIKMLPAPVLHISGRVTAAIAGGGVNVQLTNGLWNRTGVTGADGKFIFWRVPAGRYLLLAESSSGGNSRRSAPAPIDLTSASIEGVHLALEHGIDLALKLKDAERERYKEELAGLSIALKPVGSLEESEPGIPMNSDGVFPMNDVWPGRYHVLARGLPDNAYVKAVRSGEREFPDGILELSGGAAEQEMVLELGSDGAEISGVVRDRKGGVRGKWVALFFDDAFGYDLAGTTRTADDGSYVFHGIAPGRYKLLAYDSKDPMPQWSAETLELYRNVIEKVEVNEGGTKALDLKMQTTETQQ